MPASIELVFRGVVESIPHHRWCISTRNRRFICRLPDLLTNYQKAGMKKILLVDDDPVCNLLMTKCLDRVDIPKEIQTVMDGVEAVGRLKEYHPDIIFLDLNMPVMDGFQFIQMFKKMDIPYRANVKIVIVSSSPHYRDIEKAKKMGVDFLTKPVTVEQLQAVM